MATLALWLAACVEPYEKQEPEGCLFVGALLPFTRTSGGANVERALLLGIEQINAAGGTLAAHQDPYDTSTPLVGARPLCLRSIDTGSLDGVAAAQDILPTASTPTAELGTEAKIAALLGPSDDDVAKGLFHDDIARDSAAIIISGGATTHAISNSDDKDRFFRTNPTTALLGHALAHRMLQDGRQTIAILYENGGYGSSWNTVVTTKLLLPSRYSVSFDRDAGTFRRQLQAVASLDPAPDAVVLVADPRAGSTIVTEWAAMRESANWTWYLTPTLKDELFLQNIPAGALDRFVGISPEVDANSALFRSLFADRWDGDKPNPAAHFYYDALLTWALTAQTTLIRLKGNAGQLPLADTISTVLRETSTRIDGSYADLPSALAKAREGKTIRLSGSTGTITFDGYGERFISDDVLIDPAAELPVEVTSVVEFWAICGDAFLELTGDETPAELCPPR